MNGNIVQNIPIAPKEYKLKSSKQTGNDTGDFNLVLKENIKSKKEDEQENNLVAALNVLLANILNADKGINSIKDLKLLSENPDKNVGLAEKIGLLTGLDKSKIEKLMTSFANNKNLKSALEDLLNTSADFKDEIFKNNINIQNVDSDNLEDKLDKLLDKILLKNDRHLVSDKSLITDIPVEKGIKEFKGLKNLHFSEEINPIFSKENSISNSIVADNKISAPTSQPVINMNSGTKVNDLIEIIEYIKNGESKKMTVKLEPDFLGKMNIHLTENAGKITAKIFVEQEVVKHFLVANMDSIKQQLNDKGIVIDNMNFMFMGDHQNQQEFKEAKNQNNNNIKAAVKVEQDEITENNKSVSGIYA